ncbi:MULTISPECIES: homoserine O-acetyltransferase MetA [Aliivibrio]|uniref:Homoserine O-succinyltransferase n=4 Tax=Aliivibrio fischeri TaxID=668 RepID=METAS_ALIFM|nr:homoserine O-succinyltransferase [Aliivibrio fischeri]B5FA49.1 RecName: Full=Homoserine O-succinyltransferase; Short=HST; AltName: Full=Homoserine transsuccinylase; Short=HTS [Aliivibrio fischeri MJ11]MBD1568973.1 homoserine O-succinyltransferase [Aliivibrio sp. S10_S31]ACH66787.1 homoserine O-succinyltransferase [Aliivibrio fischeri MJ11]EHN70472.1 homoserine O-succinyltransferase [Aliivibrio fischeri SR5]MCE4935084.1 homoserine O-succinyltransferase [Aliivibrio fischeri]MCE7554409.1 homo
MPIKIPDQLPATEVLREENIFFMQESRATTQAIRPLKVIILNLMPKKIETETQFLRLLSNSPLQVDVELLRIDNRTSKNTPTEHLDTFYRQFEGIKDRNFDGLIITGAPLGLVQFEDVIYWDHLQTIMTWAKDHVTSSLYVCWAAQAGLKLLYDLPKRTRKEKLSGVYKHTNLDQHHPILRGFDDQFLAPHSRYADFSADYLKSHTDLDILATSKEAGVYLAATKDKRNVFVTGHPEYDSFTLHNEYVRDLGEGMEPTIPVNYYPDDNPDITPKATWRSHGHLLFSNWLNYCVYQQTPYDLEHFSEQNFTRDE